MLAMKQLYGQDESCRSVTRPGNSGNSASSEVTRLFSLALPKVTILENVGLVNVRRTMM